MTIDQLTNALPDFAKDIRLNLRSVLSEEGAEGLTEEQIAGIALACSYTTKNPALVSVIDAEVSDKLSDQAKEAAKAASTIIAMNNVYYRFTHLVHDEALQKLPAKLRMNVIANPGVDKIDFELYSLAVSAINGCGMCMESHTRVLKKAEVSDLGIQSAIRIAAVIAATAQALTIAAT